jgi:hypothetical protein
MIGSMFDCYAQVSKWFSASMKSEFRSMES